MDTFKRIIDVMSVFQFKSPSSIYTLIKKGVFPPPIKLNNRSLWLEGELKLMQASYIAGLNHQKKREVVAEILKRRTKVLAELNNKLKEPQDGDLH